MRGTAELRGALGVGYKNEAFWMCIWISMYIFISMYVFMRSCKQTNANKYAFLDVYLDLDVLYIHLDVCIHLVSKQAAGSLTGGWLRRPVSSRLLQLVDVHSGFLCARPETQLC